VLRRHFSWEVGKLLDRRFLAIGRDEQQVVQEGVRKLADTYLTEEVRRSLDVQHRVSISVAQRGTLDDTIAVSRHYADHGLEPIVESDGRLYIGYPGFRTPGKAFPDEWFEATRQVLASDRQTAPAKVAWGRAANGRPALVLNWRTTLPAEDLSGAAAEVEVSRGPAVPAVLDGDRGEVAVRAAFPLDSLVGGERGRGLRKISFVRTVAEWTGGYEVKAGNLAGVGRRLHRVGPRLYLVTVGRDKQRRVGVRVLPLTARVVAERLRRRLRRR
jgi:hypothetical protein